MEISGNIWTTGPVRSLITNGVDRLTRSDALALLKTGDAGLYGIITEPDFGMPYLVNILRYDLRCVAHFQASNEDIDRLLHIPPSFDSDGNPNPLCPDILND